MDPMVNQPNQPQPDDEPVLLVSLGETSAATLGTGGGRAEDKRRLYN